MGQLRSLLRSYAWEGSSPGEVLARADELVRGLDIADIATCAYLRWRSDRGRRPVTYARAGHPPPLLRLPGGEVRALDEGLSTPIGLAGPGGAEATIDVPAGATLVLYTDGLVERRDRGLREGIAALTAELCGAPRRRRRRRRQDRSSSVHRRAPGGRRLPARGQARAAHQLSSSSRAASAPSGPRSIRSSSRYLYASPTSRPGREPEDLHDLRAVEVGADRVELLLLRAARDPRLEVVVRGGQPRGLALVARGAVGPGQPVQPLEQRAGVGDVAAHGGVGPARPRRTRGTAGAARPAARPPARSPCRTAAPCSRLAASLAPTISWWWKLTPPPCLEPPRRAACRCRAAARRAAAPGPGRAPRRRGRSPGRSPGRAR